MEKLPESFEHLSDEQLKQMMKRSYLLSLEQLKISSDEKEMDAIKKFIEYYENL